MEIKQDSPVIILKGHQEGNTGKVARVEPLTGWVFVLLDRHKDNPAYCNVQYGPYCAHELELFSESVRPLDKGRGNPQPGTTKPTSKAREAPVPAAIPDNHAGTPSSDNASATSTAQTTPDSPQLGFLI